MKFNLSTVVADIVINISLKSMIHNILMIFCVLCQKTAQIRRVPFSINTHIEFTFEKENESSIHILDPLAIKTSDNIVKHDWFIKPTPFRRFLNYLSCHDIRPKNKFC